MGALQQKSGAFSSAVWRACLALSLGVPGQSGAAATGAADKAPAPVYQEGTVPLPEGGQLAYYLRDGDGPTLVLIPGSWGDFRVFDHLVEALSPRLRIIIVELRGHGGSWPPTLDASIERFAEDVLRVTDTLGLERFYVGGHSIGGMIPIEIVKRRPAQVSGAIAMEGWTHYTVQKNAFGGVTDPPLTPAQAQERQSNRARVQDRLTQRQIDAFASAWKKWDGYPILETTTVPILEIWGDRGATPPARTVMRIPDRPNIRVVWIAGASHAMLVERPDAVATAINAFIELTEASRQAP